MQHRQNNSNRPARIAAKVKTLVAEILRDMFGDDPIVSAVSLVGAAANGGGQFVKLFFYCRGDAGAAKKRLDEITRMVRYELAGRMNQKYVPEIRFEYDDTLERADKIESLLNKIAEK